MRRHDEDRLVHQLRHAKTLQGTYAPAAHVQLIYAMHAVLQCVYGAEWDAYSLCTMLEYFMIV